MYKGVPFILRIYINLTILLLFVAENETSQCDTDSIIVTEANADYLNQSPEGVIIDVKPDFSIDNSLYLEEVIQEEIEDDDFEWKEDQQINYIEENIIEDSISTIDETRAPSSGSEKSDNRSKKGRNKRGSSRSGERACLPAIHSCVLCDKKWRTVTELKSHIQSHSALRPYVCEVSYLSFCIMFFQFIYNLHIDF